MNEEATSPRFPIGEVARRTGLSPHVLRAWERRYGAVEPSRREGGGRLYSPADILRVRLLRRLTEAGHPIGEVATLSTEALLALLPGEEGEAGQAPVPARAQPATAAAAGGEENALSAALAALEALNGEQLHGILMRAAVALSSRDFLQGLVLPLLHRTGTLWAEGQICPAHEHLLSSQLQRVLGWLASAIPVPSRGDAVVVATPSGQRHEFGALLAGIVAAEEGWRVAYLGTDLPASDLATAVEALHARAVLLGVALRGEAADSSLAEVAALREAVGPLVGILVGGAGVAERREAVREAGATFIPDLDALREVIGTLASSGRAA